MTQVQSQPINQSINPRVPSPALLAPCRPCQAHHHPLPRSPQSRQPSLTRLPDDRGELPQDNFNDDHISNLQQNPVWAGGSREGGGRRESGREEGGGGYGWRDEGRR